MLGPGRPLWVREGGEGAGRGNERREEAVRARVPTSSCPPTARPSAPRPSAAQPVRPHQAPHAHATGAQLPGHPPGSPSPLPSPRGLSAPLGAGLRAGLTAGLRPDAGWRGRSGCTPMTSDQRGVTRAGGGPPFAGTRASRPVTSHHPALLRLPDCRPQAGPLTSTARPLPEAQAEPWAWSARRPGLSLPNAPAPGLRR